MEATAEIRKLEEEQKIKDEILQEEIQNEILLPNKQTELRGELKQKQWEKCKEGLARHRAIKKKQSEEEKLKREQEKQQLKQKIREEMMREKLKMEVEKELESKFEKVESLEKEKTAASIPKTSSRVELQLEDLEEYLKWKKESKRKKSKKEEKEEGEESDSEEDDFVFSAARDMDSEEDEEITSRQRYKRSRQLPPRANLERTVSRSLPRPTQKPASRPILYNSPSPGKYFYI